MIPVLYSKKESVFVGNGLGLLSDAVSCECSETLNKSYELSLKIKSTSIHANDIEPDCVIKAKPNYEDPPQPFRVYSVEKDYSGNISVNAAHISYDTIGIPVLPFSVQNLNDAIDNMNNNRKLLSSSKFVLNSSFSAEGEMEVKSPSSFRSLLCGNDNSIIDIYKGELHYHDYTIDLLTRRGTNKGVCFRYGQNISDFDQTLDSQEMYSSVLGFWKKSGSNNQNDTIVYGNIIKCDGEFPYDKIYIYDTSNIIKNDNNADATVDQIDEEVAKYIKENAPGISKNNIKIDYTKDDELIQVCVGDLVGIIYPEYKINLTARCKTVVFDSLEEKNISIEIGTEEKDIIDVIADLSAKT